MATIRIPSNKKFGMIHSDVVAALRALAQDAARTRLESSAIVTDFTDSTTGTAAQPETTVAVTLPAYANADGTNLAPKAGFDTAINVLDNVTASFALSLNPILATIGYPLLVDSSGGTASTAGTIPAITKTLTAVTGASDTGLDAATGRAQLSIARNNQATILRAINAIASAVGDASLPDNVGGSPTVAAPMTLAAQSNSGTGVTGLTTYYSLTDTAVDLALTTIANNYATMIAFLNGIMGAPVADLTDSSGGTASNTLAAVTVPPAYTSEGAGTCAPKAAFDTLVQVIENNQSDLAARINVIARRFNETQITISTGVTPDTTLAAQAASLTGVDGTTLCVDRTTAVTTFTAILNNYSTLAAAVNTLAPYYGQKVLTDSSGGTASATTTLVNVPTTTTGNDGTASATMSDAAMDTALAVLQNATASLAAKLAAMTGSDVVSNPLRLVAS
jgi:hypothetical protein